MNFYLAKRTFLKKLRKEVKPWRGTPVALSGGVDSSVLAALVKPRFVISVQLPGGRKYNELNYSRMVAQHLGIKQIVVKPDPDKFDEYMRIAVKAIGRPIPHFNIFPLFCMYMKLHEMGEENLILGDGPDETMCGYTRNLIMNYLHKVYDFEAFENYKPMIDKVDWKEIYSRFTGKKIKKLQGKTFLQAINAIDIEMMRPDMDDMSNGIADYFGILNIRPYQDNPVFDRWQFNLPDNLKILQNQWGKYLLRAIAQEYLPEEIAWRKKKVGGPVYPVNILKGWDKYDGEFGKEHYLRYQEKLLHGK